MQRVRILGLICALAALVITVLFGAGAAHAGSLQPLGNRALRHAGSHRRGGGSPYSPAPTPTPTVAGCAGPWHRISNPNPGTYFDSFSGVAAVAADNIWAVGSLSNAYLGSMTLTEHWDGTQWSVISSPNNTAYDSLFAVAADSANDVWAVGQSGSQALIEHWNGTSWSTVPGANPTGGKYASLTGVTALSTSDAWAVGGYQDQNGIGHTLTEQWNGTSWTIVSSPTPGTDGAFNATIALSSSDVWAVGYYYPSGYSSKQTLTEHWDGNTWSVVTSPSTSTTHDNELEGITAISTSDIWAVGHADPSVGFLATLTEHWNGTSWTIVPSPNHDPSIEMTGLLAVAAVSSTNVWAVGGDWEFFAATVIEHWDGTRWSIMPGTNEPPLYPYGVLTSVVIDPRLNVLAVGSTAGGQGGSRTLMEEYQTYAPLLCPRP